MPTSPATTKPATGATPKKPAPARKPAVAKKAAPARKPVAAKKPAAKVTRPKAAKPVKAAKPAKTPKAARPVKPVESEIAKVKKSKLVRDSFSMPEPEYAVLGSVKKACLKAGVEVKKSELLRIGVALIAKMDVDGLKAVLATLPPLKAGRPKSK